jgi:hypothetical protein
MIGPSFEAAEILAESKFSARPLNQEKLGRRNNNSQNEVEE